jgi:L-ascorbate peroxidase
MLPLDMHAKPDFLLELFQNKSMNARELAALVGAHATSRSFHQTPPGRGDIGLPQDSTPGVWDVNFYAETTNPPEGVFVFDSDLALSQHAVVGPEFNAFVGRQGRWNAAFVRAMTKMSLFGVPGGSANLTDCTEFIPQGTRKRDIRSAPINDRVR